MPSISHNNLYEPIMYILDNYFKRETRGNGGPNGEMVSKQDDTNYIEGVQLERDRSGRVTAVRGWEYVDYDLKFGRGGRLESVFVTHKLTGRHLQIKLHYNDRHQLEEVEPIMLSEGSGQPGKINIPKVI